MQQNITNLYEIFDIIQIHLISIYLLLIYNFKRNFFDVVEWNIITFSELLFSVFPCKTRNNINNFLRIMIIIPCQTSEHQQVVIFE